MNYEEVDEFKLMKYACFSSFSTKKKLYSLSVEKDSQHSKTLNVYEKNMF